MTKQQHKRAWHFVLEQRFVIGYTRRRSNKTVFFNCTILAVHVVFSRHLRQANVRPRIQIGTNQMPHHYLKLWSTRKSGRPPLTLTLNHAYRKVIEVTVIERFKFNALQHMCSHDWCSLKSPRSPAVGLRYFSCKAHTWVG